MQSKGLAMPSRGIPSELSMVNMLIATHRNAPHWQMKRRHCPALLLCTIWIDFDAFLSFLVIETRSGKSMRDQRPQARMHQSRERQLTFIYSLDKQPGLHHQRQRTAQIIQTELPEGQLAERIDRGIILWLDSGRR